MSHFNVKHKTVYAVILTGAISAGALACDKAADDQQKATVAQTEANDKIATAKREEGQKVVAAQGEADTKIAAAQATFSSRVEDYRHTASENLVGSPGTELEFAL